MIYRWTCERAACRRKKKRRKSTKARYPVPRCPGCNNWMRLDLYRTTGLESRKVMCRCSHGWGDWPHRRKSCENKMRREFEESHAELECA